jgi:hypothetical protein
MAAAGAGPARVDITVKIVYRAENIIDANLVKGALAQEGVLAFVSGEYLTGAIGELPAWNLVAVMVAEHDIERAAPIVQAIDAALREQRRDHDDRLGTAVPA